MVIHTTLNTLKITYSRKKCNPVKFTKLQCASVQGMQSLLINSSQQADQIACSSYLVPVLSVVHQLTLVQNKKPERHPGEDIYVRVMKTLTINMNPYYNLYAF